MIEIIGWIGQLLLAACAIPQAIHSIKVKHAKGISWVFLLFWYIGEILSFIYIIPIGKIPLLINYMVNIICITIIVYIKHKENKHEN